MIKQKFDYLLRSIINFRQKKECPFCGGNKLKKIDRKYLFTSLLKCDNCKLSHRHPKDNDKWLREFYQKDYSIDTHMMTKLHSDIELETLKKNNFSTLRSYDKYIKALFKVNNNLKIIDYGCSWGYNVYQLINSGYDAVGYELSIPRAKFGKAKLSVPIIYNPDQLPENNDLILSSHTIEHLNNINDFISLCKKHLKLDGIFIAFCPNGSEAYAKREPSIYHINWGAVHPNYLSVEFAQYVFKDNPYLILTGDWEFDPNQLSKWDGLSQVTNSYQEGKELLIISKPNIKI